MHSRSSFGLLFTVTICVLGCNNPPPNQSTDGAQSSKPGTHTHADGTVHADDDHGHSHDNPPHGGTVFLWGGGKYHMEFKVDSANSQATVYVLAANLKDNLAIDTESMEVALDNPKVQITLSAEPQDGDSQGQSSRFVGQHEAFSSDQKFSGMVFGTIGETPYSGEFAEK